jgi:putative colanic acid biosynthesis acetyltransferase WcaF
LKIGKISQLREDDALGIMKLDGYKSYYKVEKSKLTQLIWYVYSAIVFESSLFPTYRNKIGVLKLFGAKVGRGFVIKPKVYIKYPWNLEVGDNVWIGEGVRIDNLALVKLGSNVCVSQNAFLLTGNHNYRSAAFELMTGPITIEDEVWVGASSVVCPNTVLSKGTIITVGSVVSGTTSANRVYQGNPAIDIKPRYK